MRPALLALTTAAIISLMVHAAHATPGALNRHGCHGHGARHHCHRGMAGKHFVGWGGGGHRFAHRHGRRWGHHRRHRRH
ncbi:hypothetical protein [Methylobacterium sp. B1]|uniref:hypothetical protein n=1 Tax=Methylobacterium sp. B1 TaxID=91459 RepID=UPI0011D1C985|nr:hypothetical protein [Methylobacterium sp. B1]